MPTLFFADLVRELANEGGTGPLLPAGALPGHRRFVDAVPVDTSFHYAIAGIAEPGEWEVGSGRIGGDGRLLRDAVAASSNGGAPVDFGAGLKTIALTVGAGWFAAREAGEAALAAVIAAKPPIAATAGSAAEPAIGFAGDGNSGLFNPAADTVAISTGGFERMRLTATGLLGIGTNAPAASIHVKTSGSNPARLQLDNGAGHQWGLQVHPSFDLFQIYRAGTLTLQVSSSQFRPGTDNMMACGWPTERWSVVYSATGTINTSDARDKVWRGAPTAAELRAARRIAGEIGAYQWTEAIAAKGAGAARMHFGVRAQAVWAIMADEGLVDPIGADGRPGATPYGFLCFDEWDGGSRFGVRPDELALFLIAAQEARLAALEAGA